MAQQIQCFLPGRVDSIKINQILQSEVIIARDFKREATFPRNEYL